MRPTIYLIGYVERFDRDGMSYLHEYVVFYPRGTGWGTGRRGSAPSISIGGAGPHEAGGNCTAGELLTVDGHYARPLAETTFRAPMVKWFLPLVTRLAAGAMVEDQEVESAYAEANGGRLIKKLDAESDVYEEMGAINRLRGVASEPDLERGPAETEAGGERLGRIADGLVAGVRRRLLPPDLPALQAAWHLGSPGEDGSQASLLLSRHYRVCVVTFPWLLNRDQLGLLRQRAEEAGFMTIPFRLFLASPQEWSRCEIETALGPDGAATDYGRRMVHHEDMWWKFFDFI